MIRDVLPHGPRRRRLREQQHWLARALRACAGAHLLGAVGAAARAYTLRRCCCVWRTEFDTALANVCVCFASAPPRRMTHTGSTFSGKANFYGTCIITRDRRCRMM